MRRAEKLDIECTDEDTTEPFKNALKNKFNSGGVHPLVFGAFGETNTECDKMIRMCAKYAATRAENADVTPLNNTRQKGSSYQVMLTQFRRAIGVLSMRTMAEVKLRRTHFIRSSKNAANAAAQPEHRRYYENESNPFWYQNRRNQETFQEFYAYHAQYSNESTEV